LQKTALFFLCNKPSRLKEEDFKFSRVVVQFFSRRPIGFRRLLPAGSLQKTVRQFLKNRPLQHEYNDFKFNGAVV
jgi:hypothetical protein